MEQNENILPLLPQGITGFGNGYEDSKPWISAERFKHLTYLIARNNQMTVSGAELFPLDLSLLCHSWQDYSDTLSDEDLQHIKYWRPFTVGEILLKRKATKYLRIHDRNYLWGFYHCADGRDTFNTAEFSIFNDKAGEEAVFHFDFYNTF